MTFKELIGSTKATHIYKGTQAQTRQQTFVKECCLLTLPKPLTQLKPFRLTNPPAHYRGVAAMLADVVTINFKSLSAIIQLDVILFSFLLLTSTTYFQLGSSSGLDIIKFQHSSKPYRYRLCHWTNCSSLQTDQNLLCFIGKT